MTSASYDAVNVGGIVGISRFLNHYVGIQGELGIHEYGVQQTGNATGSTGNDDGFTTVAGGLILRAPSGNWTPFAHGLFGGALVSGPFHNPNTWGPDVTVGGGLDYETPLLNHHLAIRLVQADYEYMHVDFGGNWNTANINAVRLSAGVVFHAGEFAPPTPVTLACSASPATVFPGDPVTVTATAGSLSPKLNVIYNLTGPGVTSNTTTATVATAALAPGNYTVNCGVKEGKPGKEGLKPWESANATASFTVKQFEPPTISCSASPSTIKPGETSTVTASGVSPQNRPLTYSFTASSGSISGSGATATFNSAGAPTGVAGVTCNVSDDKGQTATANTTVTITAPYVAPIPHTQALCTISFSKDAKRPTRVDNEAKACLDEVALDLQKQSDAKVVVVGEANAKEVAKTAKEEKAALKHKHAKVDDLAAERAVNTKDYLVTEKGIDASRVSVATGTADGQSVEDYLVPAGADFATDVAGTKPVSETTVKPVARKPLPVKAAHKKPAAKKAAEPAK
jgi:outer membrane protein OmpA-like peptidoglycan-associated protein